MTQPSSKESFVNTLPSTASLIKTCVFAVIFGLLILFTIILPAEYGIDPTGIGSSLGLTRLSKPMVVKTEPTVTTEQVASLQKHTHKIVIPAGSGLEYKFQVDKGEKIEYVWVANGELYFDLHGEPEGDTSGYFESYAESTAKAMKGVFITPFEGSHGWYWKNKGDSDKTVTLTVAGKFEVIGLK